MRKSSIRPFGYAIAIMGALFALAHIFAAGCSNRASLAERLDAVRENYYSSVHISTELTSFIEPLLSFNVEEKSSYDNLRDTLQGCMAAADEAGKYLSDLGSYDYSGEMEYLGEYIMEYKDGCAIALDELEGVYGYLESLLVTLEPWVHIIEKMPKLSGSESLKPLVHSYQEMLAFSEPIKAALAGMAAPPVLNDFHSLMKEIVQNASNIFQAYIAIAMTSDNPRDVSGNQYIIQHLALKGRYQQLVPGLFERLKISGLDPYMEKVELEINRLYLGRS